MSGGVKHLPLMPQMQRDFQAFGSLTPNACGHLIPRAGGNDAEGQQVLRHRRSLRSLKEIIAASAVWRELVGNGQCFSFKRLKCNLLSEHNVSRHELTFRKEA
jgi:hypothetical protein